MEEYDFTISFATKMAQWRAKNSIIEDAIATRADYVLVLDDDMIPTVDLDWLRVLINHRKEVIGALYFQRGGNYHPVAMKGEKLADGKTMAYEFYEREELEDGLMKVGVIGGGCQLVKMTVFQKIIRPWYYENGLHGQDVYFCQKLREAGIDCWLDTTVQLGHIVRDRYILQRETLPDNELIKGTPYFEAYQRERAILRARAEAVGSSGGGESGVATEASDNGGGTV